VPLALPVLALAAAAAGQERQAVPTFPSRVDLVTVDVVVLDREGRPVRDLRREDFSLLEDGRRQEIATFEVFSSEEEEEEAAATPAGPAPAATRRGPGGARTFVLLVDDVGIAPSRGEVAVEALRRLLDEGLREGDEALFATTSGDAWWSARMPEGREDLLALIGRIRGRLLGDDGRDAISEWEAFRIVHFEGSGGRASIGSDGGSGSAGPPTAPRPAAPPGADLTDRVVMRYYERRVCNPDPPAVTPREQCTAMVLGKAQLVDQRRANRTRDVLAAVDRAVFALTGARGRKSLLLLTEGFLNDPDLRGVQEVASRCREANVAVHSLDVRGLLAANPGLSATDWAAPNIAELGIMRSEQLEAQAAGNVGLAEDTGGFAVRDTNDLGGGALRVAQESRVYYLLGYAPPEGKGPRDWRRLQVEVSRPGVKVRARRGYTLRSAAEIAAAGLPGRAERKAADKAGGTPEPPTLPTEVARALLSPEAREDIPLRAMAYAFEERPRGLLAVTLVVEADLAALANLGGAERPQGVLSLSALAAHRDSGRRARIDQQVKVDAGMGGVWEGWLSLRRELELPPGIVQARVVVRDEFLGRLGATTVRFEVPSPGALRISTPILTDRLRREAAGAPPSPVMLARREFRTGADLYCLFEVYGGTARVGGPLESSHLLRRADGRTLQEGPASPIEVSRDGRRVRLLRFPLEGLAPGEYELVVRVEDKASGRVVERTEAFRVRAAGS
jgi:hypothetical protein